MPKTELDLSEDQTEAIKAIQEINNENYDKVNWEEHIDLLGVNICSYYFSIVFYINTNINIEIPIFNSENDDRIFYEKSNKYENWKPYIKRKFGEIKSQINEIKL